MTAHITRAAPDRLPVLASLLGRAFVNEPMMRWPLGEHGDVAARFVEQFGYFLDRLKAIPEGNGTLLDHSMLVYGCAIADGNAHAHHDLPVLVAGRGNGTIATGRHMRVTEKTPMANLFLSMMDRMGVEEERIGDSSSSLSRTVRPNRWDSGSDRTSGVGGRVAATRSAAVASESGAGISRWGGAGRRGAAW